MRTPRTPQNKEGDIRHGPPRAHTSIPLPQPYKPAPLGKTGWPSPRHTKKGRRATPLILGPSKFGRTLNINESAPTRRRLGRRELPRRDAPQRGVSITVGHTTRGYTQNKSTLPERQTGESVVAAKQGLLRGDRRKTRRARRPTSSSVFSFRNRS